MLFLSLDLLIFLQYHHSLPFSALSFLSINLGNIERKADFFFGFCPSKITMADDCQENIEKEEEKTPA